MEDGVGTHWGRLSFVVCLRSNVYWSIYGLIFNIKKPQIYIYILGGGSLQPQRESNSWIGEISSPI